MIDFLLETLNWTRYDVQNFAYVLSLSFLFKQMMVRLLFITYCPKQQVCQTIFLVNASTQLWHAHEVIWDGYIPPSIRVRWLTFKLFAASVTNSIIISCFTVIGYCVSMDDRITLCEWTTCMQRMDLKDKLNRDDFHRS